MSRTIEQLKKRAEKLAEQNGGNAVLVCIPDNGRNPTLGIGRQGSVIVYDKDHPAESFMSPAEQRNSVCVNIDEEDSGL
ncbi:MAG TPA: hypothetical protein PKM50_08060 [Methanoregula sp.]|nr:hypothetical protein [Methanoregula sp.]